MHTGIFGVLDDGKFETGGGAQDFTHEVVVEDGLAIVTDGDCPGALQVAEIG
jgi:hypothetical protein